MAAVNKVILVGNLGADPETRYMPSGDAITTIRLATSERYKDKSGEQQERTEWHRVVFFGKLAEIVGQYLKKGSKVYVEGRLQTRKWQGQDGQDRYTTEVVVDQSGTMQMLDARGQGAGDFDQGYGQSRQQAPASGPAGGGSHQAPAQQQPSQPYGGGQPPADDGFDDDIPF